MIDKSEEGVKHPITQHIRCACPLGHSPIGERRICWKRC